MKIREVLATKGSQVYCVGPEQTAREALGTLVQHRVGALLVVDDRGRAAGIISERDVLRLCLEREGDLARIPVRDVMTKDLIVGVPDDDLDYVMGVMTKNRIRHLPVLDGERIGGMISIGDVVKACLEDREYENRYLREYIEAR